IKSGYFPGYPAKPRSPIKLNGRGDAAIFFAASDYARCCVCAPLGDWSHRRDFNDVFWIVLDSLEPALCNVRRWENIVLCVLGIESDLQSGFPTPFLLLSGDR